MPYVAIVIDMKDNVATAAEELAHGSIIQLEIQNETIEVELIQSIPSGHKFALTDIETGEPIIKYGEVIGLAISNIKKGELVHTHNVEGVKGRGDQS